ncbi:MAG: RHS repeat domain-containing protein [Flavobacterium sp.]
MSSALGTTYQLGFFPNQANNFFADLTAMEDFRDVANAKVHTATAALSATYSVMNQSIALPNPAVEGVSTTLPFNPELYDAYFYHSDHLGSSNYISNNTGIVSQHTEYLPFGETFVDEHLNSHNTPFKFNAKELDDETGNYYYGARYYNPKWSTWLSVDPLAEEAPDWTPYRYGFHNPLKYIDPTGMLEDDFVFDENGDFVRIDENDQPDKLVIENSKTGERQNYSFADPVEDTQQIRDGIINKIIFVGESDIKDMLSQQGAFTPENQDNWSNFYKESKGGQDFDYSYSVIPSRYGSEGASSNPLNNPSSVLFLPEGDHMVHNHMNFGNYLWAASGYTLGFSYSTLQMAAHANSLVNSKSNGYPAQLDSKDDQRSIVKGAYYSSKNGFRQILQSSVEKQKQQNKR